MSSDQPPRRWFRYSLRTLFVLLTVLGIGVGSQLRILYARRSALHWVMHGGHPYAGAASFPGDAKRPAPWIIIWMGEPALNSVTLWRKEFEQEKASGRIQWLRGLFPEMDVSVQPDEGYAVTYHPGDDLAWPLDSPRLREGR